jgi:hypothetical protein
MGRIARTLKGNDRHYDIGAGDQWRYRLGE